MFNKNEENIFENEKCIIRDNYIKAQFKLLSLEMNEMIEEDIKNLILDCYDNLIKKIPDRIKNKLKNLITEDSKSYNLEKYNYLSDGIFGIALGAWNLGILGGAVGEAALAVVVGPAGILIGIGIVVISVGASIGLSITNNIGLWFRENCFDEIVESLYNSISKNETLDTIINLSSEKYENVVKNFKHIMVNLQETLDEFQALYDILSKYYVRRENELFDGVLKKAFSEFEEKDEIKNLFKKLFIK